MPLSILRLESWYAVGYFLPTLTGSTGLTVELSRVYLSGLYASSLNYTQIS